MYQERVKTKVEEPVGVTVINRRVGQITWGAIFAGVIIAIISQVMFSFLGSSIGFAALNIESANNVKAIGAATVIWWALSGAVSLYLGGWVSGYLSGIPRYRDGMIHGLVTWGLGTIILLALLTTAFGTIVAGGVGLAKAGGIASF